MSDTDKNRKLAIATIAIMSVSLLNIMGMGVGYYANDRSVDPNIDAGGNIAGANGEHANTGIIALFYKFRLYTAIMFGILFVYAAACASMLTVLYVDVDAKPDVSKTEKNLIIISMSLMWISVAVIIGGGYYGGFRSNQGSAEACNILARIMGVCFVLQFVSYVCLWNANLL